jgi:hypothetical protein
MPVQNKVQQIQEAGFHTDCYHNGAAGGDGFSYAPSREVWAAIERFIARGVINGQVKEAETEGVSELLLALVCATEAVSQLDPNSMAVSSLPLVPDNGDRRDLEVILNRSTGWIMEHLDMICDGSESWEDPIFRDEPRA